MKISVNVVGRLAWRVGLVMLMPAAATLAYAQSSGAIGSEMSIEELKTVYLDCEREAVAGELATGEIMQCSIFYEELKRRAFDGDFKSIRAWSDTQRYVVG